MQTEQIFKKIYQELKDEMLKNADVIFLKEYEIPSMNYSKNKNIEDMYWASGIKMELYKMMEQFENKVCFTSYKDKYFFSNSAVVVQNEMMSEIARETIEENKLRKKGVETMEKLEDLKEKLFEKVEKEFEDFKQELKQKTPDEIIENAYKLTAMEGIIGELKERSFDKDELKALLKEKDLLSEFYEDWRNSDGKLCESVQYPMEDTINIIVENYEKNRKEKLKKSR